MNRKHIIAIALLICSILALFCSGAIKILNIQHMDETGSGAESYHDLSPVLILLCGLCLAAPGVYFLVHHQALAAVIPLGLGILTAIYGIHLLVLKGVIPSVF